MSRVQRAPFENRDNALDVSPGKTTRSHASLFQGKWLGELFFALVHAHPSRRLSGMTSMTRIHRLTAVTSAAMQAARELRGTTAFPSGSVVGCIAHHCPSRRSRIVRIS